MVIYVCFCQKIWMVYYWYLTTIFIFSDKTYRLRQLIKEFAVCVFPNDSTNMWSDLWNAQVTVQMIYIILIGAILPCFHDQLKCVIFRGLKID
jgi:hypothetical protein